MFAVFKTTWERRESAARVVRGMRGTGSHCHWVYDSYHEHCTLCEYIKKPLICTLFMGEWYLSRAVFLKKRKYWLIDLAVPGLRCSMWDLWSSLRHAESFSYSMWTLSCSMWHLVSWPGVRPSPPALEVQSLSHWTTRKLPIEIWKKKRERDNLTGSVSKSRSSSLRKSACFQYM